MPTIFIFFGLRFVFFSNDHEPVHLHVIRGKNIQEYAVFQIVPDILLLKNKGLSPRELKLATKVIKENKEIIIEYWNNYFNKNSNGYQS